MTNWLLDTNVLSELRRLKPDRRVRAFIAAQPIDRLFVSSVTFAEIRFGIEVVDDPGRRVELNDWLTNRPAPRHDDRVPRHRGVRQSSRVGVRSVARSLA